MASDAEKILRKMRRKKSNHPARDVLTVYLAHGFIKDLERGKGSHTMVFHKEYRCLFATLPKTGTAAQYVVKDLLRLVDRLNELTGADS